MKFYLAAKYSRRLDMVKRAEELCSLDRENICVASWVFGGEEGMSRSDIATLDLEDIDRADTLIVFCHPRGKPQPGGGRFVEFGYALGTGKRCVCIGPFENVFMETPEVERYSTWKEFITHESLSNRKSEK